MKPVWPEECTVFPKAESGRSVDDCESTNDKPSSWSLHEEKRVVSISRLNKAGGLSNLGA